MAKDSITGIRIGKKIFEEGSQYRRFQLPQFLLQPKVYRDARVEFDITGKRLTITVANREGTEIGEFSARGKAVGVSGGIATDFKVKQVVEVARTRTSSGSRLQRGEGTAGKPFRFNAAYKQVKDGSGPLPSKTWQSLAFSSESSSSSIRFSRRDVEPQRGPFAQASGGEWWAPVL
jgi:hypothetical protein